jgi:hypothetical protein
MEDANWLPEGYWSVDDADERVKDFPPNES